MVLEKVQEGSTQKQYRKRVNEARFDVKKEKNRRKAEIADSKLTIREELPRILKNNESAETH